MTTKLPYTGDQAGYDADGSIRADITPLMRTIHRDPSMEVLSDPRERQRVVLERTLVQAFGVPEGNHDRSSWQYKAALKMYRREEKTDFGRRSTAFSGKISRDTSQGRLTRTDFTANCEMREASAAAAPERGVVAPANKSASTNGGVGGTMAQRIAAKRKSMMSWEDFRDKNLGELPGGTEKAMIEYRLMLDRNREERLAKGRNHRGGAGPTLPPLDKNDQGSSKRRKKEKKRLKKEEKKKRKKAKKKAKKMKKKAKKKK